MTPGVLDMRERQGSRIYRTITYKVDGTGVDMTGYTVRMKVKDNRTGSTILTLTVGSGIEWVTQASGIFRLHVSAVTMAALTPTDFGVYDLEVVPGGTEAEAFALLAGKFIVDGEVTT